MDSTKTATNVVNPVTRPTTHRSLADAVVNQFMGIAPIDLTDEMGRVLSETELKKKGCVFATIHVSRNMGKSKMKATHRITGEVNPFVTTGRGKNKKQPTMMAIETYKVSVLLNTIWQNVVDNKVEKTEGIKTGWVANKKKSNGIKQYRDCRVIGNLVKDEDETFYTNYIIFKYLSKRVITDEHGRELDAEWMDGFATKSKDQKVESEKREALKHGLSVKDDPKYRNMKFENIRFISMFGTDYVPFESAEGEVVVNKTPKTANV